jgi:hypothetical protein
MRFRKSHDQEQASKSKQPDSEFNRRDVLFGARPWPYRRSVQTPAWRWRKRRSKGGSSRPQRDASPTLDISIILSACTRACRSVPQMPHASVFTST